uniref:Secreted protein n=1 Tax=Meleagris gallopavo TaxID=9103 RepID=A0A803YMG8_MELGA
MTPVTHLWFPLLHFSLSLLVCSGNLPQTPSESGEGWVRERDALRHVENAAGLWLPPALLSVCYTTSCSRNVPRDAVQTVFATGFLFTSPTSP